MVAVEALSKQINELKAKQAVGTLTQEEAALLSELEQQYAEALEQASAEELQQIAEAAAESEAELLSMPDVGFVGPGAGLGALGLAAGGGGGGGGGGTVVSTLDSSFSGQLINGYIKDARVFQDNNGNGTFDSGEPTGTTDSLGRFSLNGYVEGAGQIIAQPVWTNNSGDTVTATDQTTGASVSTVFTAPAGSAVVSPLSTLMSAGATQEQIKQAFGLDASIDITSFDPIAAATATGASTAEIEAALKFKAASTAVSNILDVSSESLSSAGVDSASATQTAASTIATKLNTVGFSLTDATVVKETLESIINDSGAQIDTSVTAALSNSLSTKIAATNAAILSAATSGASDPTAALQQIYKAAKTAQVGLAQSATSVLEADDATAALTTLDQFDVDSEIAGASVPNNNAFGGLDFELAANEYQIEFFEGSNGGLLTDPTDTSNSVLKFVRTPDSKHYSGVSLGYLTGSTVGEIPINADAGETTINARIWSPSDSIVARMEIADSSAVAAQNMYFNVHAEATLSTGWNDVVFDFASPVVRYVDEANGSLATPIAADATYDKLSLFIDWNNGKDYAGNEVGAALTEDVTYYVDNVVMGFGEPEYYAGGADIGTGEETTEEPTQEPVRVQLYSSDTSADADHPNHWNAVENFGSGAAFNGDATDPAGTYSRVFQITSGEGYGAGVHVAFAAFPGIGAGFTDGADHFNAKVYGSPLGNLEVKFIGAGEGLDSVATIDLDTYAGSVDEGNGWYSVSIPFSEFSNADQIANHSGYLMGPPGDQADATFDFFFTDTELSSGAQYSVSQEETTEEPTQESVRIQLYSSDTSADADHPNHWNAVENFGSGAAFNGDATDPAGTYSRVFQITSGEGYGAGVHVAFAAFPGIGAGFTDGADHFNAKVYGSPLGNLEVKFIGAGEGLDSVATIDLDTYAGSVDEGNGWYSVSIPFSEFSNADQIANHSGYLMGPPGDQADATFDFFFTDTELSSGAQYSVSQEETTEEPTQESVRIQLYSSDTSADADHPNHWNAVENFGSGAAFNGDATDPAGTYSRVFQITSGEGYGAGVHVAFAAFPGIGAGFTDGADHFNAKVYGSPLGNLEVKFIGAGEGLDSVATIDLDTYAGSIDEGNGWYSVSIPFSEFSNADQIANHSGYLMGPPGDQADATFDFFFTDTELSSGAQYSVSQEETTEEPTQESVRIQLYSSDTSADADHPNHWNAVENFGSGAAFNGDATDPAGTYSRVFQITSGEGYGAGVHVAFAAFPGIGAGFTDGADHFNAKVYGSPLGNLEVKFIGAGEGLDSVATIDLDTYAGSVDEGNGWYSVSIPFSEFSNAHQIANHSGYLMGPPGDQADATFDFFFTDTELSSGAQYSVSQEETTEEPTQESVRIQLYSSDTSADADHPNHWNAVENFGSGAAFNGDATDPAGTYSRVFQITSGEGYGAGVHVAFAAFPGIGAGFTDGADHFNAKVYGSPLGNLEVKFIGAGEGLDSVATIDLDTYAGSIDEGNGWYSVSIPFSEFSNADQIANHSGYLMGPPGDQADATFDFFFTDTELSSGAQYTTYSDSPVSPADLTGYALVFEDEFNAVGESPDSTNWTFDLGNDGWGNGEAQDYQSGLDDAQIVDWDPSTAVNGALRITAKNVDGTITSARVKSDIDVGPYGYYEVRAKLPSEAGAWPAIWLLGEGGRSTWPADGEIDLVEWSSAYASGDTEIISALHYPAAHGESANDTNATLSSAVDEWHTYQLWWTPDSIKIGVDGTEADSHLVYSKPENATNNTWPYDGPMDLILNIAIGGTLGGTVPSSNFEYAMEVDYVRIYQQDGTVADLTPPELTLTFDSNDGSGFVLTDFGGNASSVVAGADAPTGSDGSVVKVLKTTGAETWAGTTFFELSGDGELISDGGSVITADVFSAKDGVAVRLKLEDSSNGNIVVELDAITESNGSDAWETLSWDLSAVDGLNHLNNYDKASIFFDFGNAGDGEVYYFDNVNFGGYIA